uniref:Uncharacterized protein n=1 Tax=Desulfotignum phosphitoxidans TaxID=190898 RepID=A7UH57_9BACT|nr:unknown [Desulfotignum phosphitoxidans DSM 13687]
MSSFQIIAKNFLTGNRPNCSRHDRLPQCHQAPSCCPTRPDLTTNSQPL